MQKKYLMKRMIILISITLSFGITYIVLDHNLYYYGKNEIHYYHDLPFQLKTEYWGSDLGLLGFRIEDKHGFAHISKGVSYFKYPNVKIDSVLSYGFNDKLLIALIEDTHQKLAYIVQTDTTTFELIPFVQSSANQDIQNQQLKWIYNVNNPSNWKTILHTWCKIIFIISFTTLIVVIIRFIFKSRIRLNR